MDIMSRLVADRALVGIRSQAAEVGNQARAVPVAPDLFQEYHPVI